MVDSLNGYLHAIPTAHSPLVRMHELIAYLNERGVATLLVAAQHGILGMAMASPVDVSYLADAVVLFRYFEAEGEVRKAISVVKKRTGAHEAAIRELVVGVEGDPRRRAAQAVPRHHDWRPSLRRRVPTRRWIPVSADAATVRIFAPIGRDAALTRDLLAPPA